MIKMRVEVKSFVGDAIRASERATSRILVAAGHKMRYALLDMTGKKLKKPRRAGRSWARGDNQLRKWAGFDVDHGRREVTLGFGRKQMVGDLHEFGGQLRRSRRRGSPILKFPARPALQLSREIAIQTGRRKWPEEWARVFGK